MYMEDTILISGTPAIFLNGKKKYIKLIQLGVGNTSLGPPGLWLAVKINAPVALDPWEQTSIHINIIHYCIKEKEKSDVIGRRR